MVIKADHYYPSSRGRDVVVILYAQLGKRPFNDWHSLLIQQAELGRITYILRHYVTVVITPNSASVVSSCLSIYLCRHFH